MKKQKNHHTFITNLEDTHEYQHLNIQQQTLLQDISTRHPMKIPQYYYNLINWEDAKDPIKKMAIPHFDESLLFG